MRTAWGRKLILDYLNGALAVELENSPRRRELLLQRVSLTPPAGKRLRACIACRQPYIGPERAFTRDLGFCCRACRRDALLTPTQMHRKAIKNTRLAHNKHQRIRRALGDRIPPPPTRCQRKGCDLDGKPTWLQPDQHGPITLCLTHRWHARQRMKLARPRPRGRPKNKT